MSCLETGVRKEIRHKEVEIEGVELGRYFREISGFDVIPSANRPISGRFCWFFRNSDWDILSEEGSVWDLASPLLRESRGRQKAICERT